MPQDPNKVKLVDASPETREKLKIYLGTLRIRKCTIGNKDIKTLEDAILFSMPEAEKVPVLENEISVLKRRIKELEREKMELIKALDSEFPTIIETKGNGGVDGGN